MTTPLIDGKPTINITLNGTQTTVAITPEDARAILENLDSEPEAEGCACSPTVESASTAYDMNMAADLMRYAQLLNQLLPLPGQAPGSAGQAPGFPGPAPGFPGPVPGFPGQTPGISGQSPGFPGQPPGFPGQAPGFPGQAPGVPAPPVFGPSTGTSPTFEIPEFPADFQLDPAWFDELEIPGLPGPGSVPGPPVEDGRVTRADVTEHLDALTLGLNAIQGDKENHHDGGLNWGPFSNDKERFDNLVADLRNNPTAENYGKLATFAGREGTLSPDSQAVFESLEETIEFLEANRGMVSDEDIDVRDGTNRLEHGLAEEEVRETLRFLRDNDNHTLSDAGNWGPFTSDKESWDNHLKDMQNDIVDGNLEGAMGHYNWLREKAEGSSNIPRRTRDKIIALEQYIPIAVAGPNEQ